MFGDFFPRSIVTASTLTPPVETMPLTIKAAFAKHSGHMVLASAYREPLSARLRMRSIRCDQPRPTFCRWSS